MRRGGEDLVVRVDAPVEVVFGYLSDPAKRPEWQSSLRRIELLSEQTSGVGATWRDVTTAGLRPVMRVTRHEPGIAWAEEGDWRGIHAVLALGFRPAGPGAEVTARFELTGRGRYAVVARLARLLAPLAVRSDLRRAARILGDRRETTS